MGRDGPHILDRIIQSHRFISFRPISGASKIPTIIYYDRAGNVKAVGAEAEKEGIYEIAEHEHWVKVEWYVSILYSSIHIHTKLGSNYIFGIC